MQFSVELLETKLLGVVAEAASAHHQTVPETRREENQVDAQTILFNALPDETMRVRAHATRATAGTEFARM